MSSVTDIELIISSLVKSVDRLKQQVELLSQHDSCSVIVKNTPGDLLLGRDAQIVINYYDNTLSIWCDGAWRRIG
jgi:hypothetical protein